MSSPEQPSETTERYECCILIPETEDLISLTSTTSSFLAADEFVSKPSSAVCFAALKRSPVHLLFVPKVRLPSLRVVSKSKSLPNLLTVPSRGSRPSGLLSGRLSPSEDVRFLLKLSTLSNRLLLESLSWRMCTKNAVAAFVLSYCPLECKPVFCQCAIHSRSRRSYSSSVPRCVTRNYHRDMSL